jgi:hypothetical protein
MAAISMGPANRWAYLCSHGHVLDDEEECKVDDECVACNRLVGRGMQVGITV